MRFGWAALLALGVVGPAAKAGCDLGAVAVLPMNSVSAPFAVPAMINGQPANLRLDTGSTSTTVNRPAADRLGLSMHLSDRSTYGLGGVQRTYYARAERFQLGGILATQYTLLGRDLWPSGSTNGLDGYLAMDVLSTYDVDIDAQGKHLIIFKATGTCLKPTVAMAPPLYAAPLVLINGDRQAAVDVIVDGQSFRALLNSGESHSMMYRKAAERLPLDLAPLYAPGHAVRRGIGPRDVALMPHVFKSVTVGGLVFHNMTIDVLDQADPGVERHRTGSLLAADTLSSGEEMTLGADFMNKVHLWISHSSHQLIMQYPPKPSALPQ